MPKDYVDFKERVRSFVRDAVKAVHFEGPLKLGLVLHQQHFVLTIEKSDSDYVYLRGDVDNLAGGIMDALQPKKGEEGLYLNDSQVRELSVRVAGKDEKNA